MSEQVFSEENFKKKYFEAMEMLKSCKSVEDISAKDGPLSHIFKDSIELMLKQEMPDQKKQIIPEMALIPRVLKVILEKSKFKFPEIVMGNLNQRFCQKIKQKLMILRKKLLVCTPKA